VLNYDEITPISISLKSLLLAGSQLSGVIIYYSPDDLHNSD